MLHPATPTTAPAWFALLQQDRNRLETWLPHLKKLKTLEDAVAYIEKNARLDFYFGERIFEIWQGEKIAGLVSLHSGSYAQQSVCLAYWLGRDFLGLGLAVAACTALISRAFVQYPRLDCIFIECEASNEASQGVARQLGFLPLPSSKQHICIFKILRTDWFSTKYDEEDLLDFLDWVE